MSDHRKSSVDEIDEKENVGHVRNVEVNPAAAELVAATQVNKPSLTSPGMIKLWIIVSVGYLISTMNGFDSSLMGSINAMKGRQPRPDDGPFTYLIQSTNQPLG